MRGNADAVARSERTKRVAHCGSLASSNDSRKKGKLSQAGISEMFRTFVQGELGIFCTAHQLRHTFATTLRRVGADLEAITTQIYAKLADETIVQTLNLLPAAWTSKGIDVAASVATLQVAVTVCSEQCPTTPPSTLSWTALLLLTMQWANA